MKKQAAMLIACLLMAGSAACAGEAVPQYKDGVYTAVAADFDESGWRDYVEIEVTGGKITEVDWNSVNEEGANKKELSREGVYDMMAAGAKSQWFEQAASMETALINKQSPAKIKTKPDGQPDAVSGVTIKVDGFLLLAQEALDEAQ